MPPLSWLPNSLTLLRLLLALALPWTPREWQFCLLLVAGSTDLIDGWLSRLWNVTSDFGQLVDPLADKFLVLAAVATAVFHGWLSWLELLALAARDLAVITLSVWALMLGWENWRRLTPRLSGKITTGGQVMALLMLFWQQQPLPLVVGLAAVLSIGSALDYIGYAVRTHCGNR